MRFCRNVNCPSLSTLKSKWVHAGAMFGNIDFKPSSPNCSNRDGS